MAHPPPIRIKGRTTAFCARVYRGAKNAAGYPCWSSIGGFEYVRSPRTLKLLEEAVELVPSPIEWVLSPGPTFGDHQAARDFTPTAEDGGVGHRRSSFCPALPLTGSLSRVFVRSVFNRIAPQLAREAERIEEGPQLCSWTASIVGPMLSCRGGRRSMVFANRLRAPIMAGEVTLSVRIWRSPRVRVGGRYRLGDGAVVVTGLHEIAMDDITPELARRSGFTGVVDLLRLASHGRGERVFLVEFEYQPDPT